MKKTLALGFGVVVAGMAYHFFADDAAEPGVMATVKMVGKTGESTASDINVFPKAATMESVRNKIGSVCAGQWNPESAIRLDTYGQIVDNDDDLRSILQQDVDDGKKPVFYVDKKAAANVPEVNTFNRR